MRTVTCYKKVDGKIQVLENGACEAEMPENEKTCELRPCAGLDWVTSEWSGVSSLNPRYNFLLNEKYYRNYFFMLLKKF